MIEQRKEKKRREDGKMEIFEALVPPFIIRTFFLFIFPYVYIFLYVYFTHNVRIARVLIKKKKVLRRQKYANHRGFHRTRRMFSRRMIQKLLRQ